ncbi:SNF7 family protein [Talaromyces proteolyticus]|uniref:Vacuolar-sorting protein SNF7 n=1 Tax=Talaromyces proteolyticus TaxID=1131652 RepID=A0AAD4KNT7_9EURO|nr:SNF7 family protein [Talaromyces proteolyticus]KAH8697088.1 SNF7 family protein [Talaromyces proteolyticus]
MWSSWFGGQSAQKRKDAPKEAILGLRGQLEMLQKRQAHLESQIVDQDAIARKNVSSNKNAAKAALRRKKLHEKNLEQTQTQIMQLEQQVYSIEAANINQETLHAMDQAGSAMKRMHDGLTMEKVDSMMDKLREQQQLAEEIGNVITQNHIGEQPDEDELEDELEALEQEAMDAKMLKTGTVPVADQLERLPAAANGERKFGILSHPHSFLHNSNITNPILSVKGKSKQTEEEDEEAELEKLRAEMAMS